MSLTTYDNYLKTLPKQHKLLKMLRPPVYEIELSNNQLNATAYYKDGSTKSHQVNADFSNRRLLFIDFATAMQALVDLLHKFPKHSYGISGIAVVNVSEELLDGLTPVETRMITELIHVASNQAKRRVISTVISYQGQSVNQ